MTSLSLSTAHKVCATGVQNFNVSSAMHIRVLYLTQTENKSDLNQLRGMRLMMLQLSLSNNGTEL